MNIITQEMLFENNVKAIIQKIEKDYKAPIQWSFNNMPDKYPDFLTWLEINPEIVGKYFKIGRAHV